MNCQTQDQETLLGGCRVLDLTAKYGYYCGKLLADLGADVIKIEPPGGDEGRRMGPFYHDVVHPETSLHWMYYNTSKRSITLNLETAEGVGLFKRLAEGADFVLESFRPGFMSSLDLGYDSLARAHEGVIVVSISPFGQTGPYSDFCSSDLVVWGMGGLMAYVGTEDRPVRIGVPQAAILGGLHAAAASMIAYYHRELTGKGQHVDVSMQEACIHSLYPAAESWYLNRQMTTRVETAGEFIRPAPHGPLRTRYIWPCKDGHVCMHLLGGANQGQAKSSTVITKWAIREGYALELKGYDWSRYDSSTITPEERLRLEEAIIPFLLTKTKEELYQAARSSGILLLPSYTVRELTESPQLAGRGFWVDVDYPAMGEAITYPGAFVAVSDCALQSPRPAPKIGEHNREVYQGEYGLSDGSMALLAHSGVI